MPQQDPNAAAPPESLLLNSFKGLKNTVSLERLGPDELTRARDILLDDAGQPRRRRGYTLKLAGKCHSLFNAARGSFMVKNGSLGTITPSGVFTAIQNFVGDEPLSYVDLADYVYFTAAAASGKIDMNDFSVQPWGGIGGEGRWLSPVVNPLPTLQPIAGKLLGPPPMATLAALYNGRIWLAHGATLWATELFMYDYVDRTKNFFQFGTPITNLGSTNDGLWLTTETNVYYLSGIFNKLDRKVVADTGGIPRSMVAVPASIIKPQLRQTKQEGDAVMFMTNRGLYAGFNDGSGYNLTEDTYLFPGAVSAAAGFFQRDGVNQYVSVLDSGGTPVSSAGVGDHADAEIIRFSGA